MLIETAIVTPVLILMSLGAFQISQVVARQSELQGAMAEASAIAITNAPDTAAERTTLKDIIVASTDLGDADVSVTAMYRCGSSTSYVSATTSCTSGQKISHYVLIRLNDTYTPMWADWGLADPIQFNVDRYVMVKQS